ncbi:MAG: hypothetical protein E7300_06855 [Lachnospiraceae bacterium]|nr:hypothetical protein [Lachnospiraceae bacterium]
MGRTIGSQEAGDLQIFHTPEELHIEERRETVTDTRRRRFSISGMTPDEDLRRLADETDHTNDQIRRTQMTAFAQQYRQEQEQARLHAIDQAESTQFALRDCYETKQSHPQKSKIARKKANSAKTDLWESQHKHLAQTAETSFYTDASFFRTEYAQDKLLQQKTSIVNGAGQSETITQMALYQRCQNGDYSNLQQLDPIMRNLLAKNFMARLANLFENGTAVDVIRALKQRDTTLLQNPVFRIGISILSRNPSGLRLQHATRDAAFYQEIEDLCNQSVMQATLMAAPLVSAQSDSQTATATQEERDRNIGNQIYMAKVLLCCHLGNLQKVDGQHSVNWPYTTATAFAHCSRVSISLPDATENGVYTSQKEEELISSLMTERDQNGVIPNFFASKTHANGLNTRGAATHTLSKKRKNTPVSKQVEQKSRGTFTGQYGMNIAIGGMGNPAPGVTGRYLKNDGCCGHVYTHIQKGSSSTYAGILVGVESDAPHMRNLTGHKHTAAASPEFVSSFGGMRIDEIGEKYGGRTVDLSGVNATDFKTKMAQLETKMRRLLTSNDPNDRQELERITGLLSGKLITDPQVLDGILR